MKKIAISIIGFILLFAPFVHAEESYLVSELKGDVQFLTRGDLSMNDSLWLEAINLGQQELTCLVDCVIDTHTQILASAQGRYALPTSFKKLIAAPKKVTGEVYEKLGVDDPGKAGTGLEEEVKKISVVSDGYTKLLKVYPVPTAADTLLLYFFKSAPRLTATTDTVKVNEYFHSALVTATLFKIYERRKDAEANRAYALLVNQINNAKISLAEDLDILIGPRIIPRGE